MNPAIDLRLRRALSISAPDIWRSERRCEALLLDICGPEDKREFAALRAATRSGGLRLFFVRKEAGETDDVAFRRAMAHVCDHEPFLGSEHAEWALAMWIRAFGAAPGVPSGKEMPESAPVVFPKSSGRTRASRRPALALIAASAVILPLVVARVRVSDSTATPTTVSGSLAPAVLPTLSGPDSVSRPVEVPSRSPATSLTPQFGAPRTASLVSAPVIAGDSSVVHTQSKAPVSALPSWLAVSQDSASTQSSGEPAIRARKSESARTGNNTGVVHQEEDAPIAVTTRNDGPLVSGNADSASGVPAGLPAVPPTSAMTSSTGRGSPVSASPTESSLDRQVTEALAHCKCRQARKLLSEMHEVAPHPLERAVAGCRVPEVDETCIDGRPVAR